MRKHVVESQLKTLRATFGDGLAPVSRDKLLLLFKKSDYTGIVKFIRDSMHLNLRLRVGLAKSHSPTKAPAWVEMPSPMPRLGTLEFKQTLATIFLSKDFLAGAKFEQVVMAVAHEMSHIVLNGLRHPLRGEETAVDLTAMLLGFRDFYIKGCETTTIKRLRHTRQETIHHLGYLTAAEVYHAGYLLGHFWARWRSHPTKQLTPLLCAITLFAAVPLSTIVADRNFQSQITSLLREIGRNTSLSWIIVLLALGISACFAFNMFWLRKPVRPRNYWNPYYEHSTRSETTRNKARDEDTTDSNIHQTFLNVFALMSSDRRQALVSYYQKQFQCNASIAMQMAIDDFRKEAQRYR